jgi:signal transduction histidine kinase
VYGELIKIYALMGDMEHSDDYLAKYKAVITKISDENLHSAIQEMEVKYDVKQKEQEITRQQDKIKRQRNIFFASMAVALVIIGFTVYIIRLRNRRNRELVEMNEIKDKFFSIISHDLKNPAIAQRNALQLLLDNSDKWDTQSLMTYYYELLKSADSQVTLLYNLLNWAQVQTGRMPYSPVPFDLAAALQSDIALINNMAKQKNITFNLHTTESALVIGDANMLTTVVRNLLANAVKFTEKGGVVSLEIKTNENEECTVSISDTGMGMSATQIQNLFRIDRHNLQKGTSGEEGSGLGLIVCKELLQKHNSVLHIESEEKKGSKIWFKI